MGQVPCLGFESHIKALVLYNIIKTSYLIFIEKKGLT